jgi:hypothetical protein
MKLKIIYIVFTAQLLLNSIAYADVSDCAEVGIFAPNGSTGLAALRISNHNDKLIYPPSLVYMFEPGTHTLMVEAYKYQGRQHHIAGGPGIGSFIINLKVEAGKRYNLGASLNGHTILTKSKKYNARIASVENIECYKKDHRKVYEAKYKATELEFSHTTQLPQNLQVEFDLLVDEIQAYYTEQALFFDGLDTGNENRLWPNIGFGFSIKTVNRKKAVVVTSVEGKEAKLLGLKENDVILRFNKVAIVEPKANVISSLYATLAAEDVYQLRVKRNDKEIVLTGVYRPESVAGYTLSISPNFGS